MTGTIWPNALLPEGTPITPERREQQYLTNLRYWLSQPWLDGVVFAENSREDLDDLARGVGQQENGRVELLAVGGNDFPGRYGKGFGEGELLDRAFSSSRLLRGAVLAVKVTGLQVVTNLERLLKRLPQGVELAVDLREHDFLERLRLGRAAKRCDTRCFAVTPDAYRRHLAGAHLGHEGREFFLEDAYYARTRTLTGEAIQLRLPIEPAFRGPAGHWGKDYSSAKERFKWAIRAGSRALLPHLWI